jgi:hypothetical protein
MQSYYSILASQEVLNQCHDSIASIVTDFPVSVILMPNTFLDLQEKSKAYQQLLKTHYPCCLEILFNLLCLNLAFDFTWHKEQI